LTILFTMAYSHQRLQCFDSLRGFIIVLVVFQHAVNAYTSLYGGRRWFVPTSDLHTFYDGLFLLTDSFIMSILFLISGCFVRPSLENSGPGVFLKKKVIRFGVPFLFGVSCIVPLLTYLRYILHTSAPKGYFEYWFGVFFSHDLQAAGFWFLAYLFLLMSMGGMLIRFYPRFLKHVTSPLLLFQTRPYLGFCVLSGISALLITLPDLYWGPFQWIGFGKVFYVRANLFLNYIFFFFMGMGMREHQLLQTNTLRRLESCLGSWVMLSFGFGVLYISYCLAFINEGAFATHLQYYFHVHFESETFWRLFQDVAPWILIRTVFHGFFCVSLTIALIALFYRFFRESTPLWTSLGACSFGIYIFHEPIVTLVHYVFLDSSMPTFMKALMAFALGLGVSWKLTHSLKTLSGLKSVL